MPQLSVENELREMDVTESVIKIYYYKWRSTLILIHRRKWLFYLDNYKLDIIWKAQSSFTCILRTTKKGFYRKKTPRGLNLFPLVRILRTTIVHLRRILSAVGAHLTVRSEGDMNGCLRATGSAIRALTGRLRGLNHAPQTQAFAMV